MYFSFCRYPIFGLCGSDNVFICFLPLYHSYAIGVFGGIAIHEGQTIIIMKKFQLERYFQLIEKYKVIGLRNLEKIDRDETSIQNHRK